MRKTKCYFNNDHDLYFRLKREQAQALKSINQTKKLLKTAHANAQKLKKQVETFILYNYVKFMMNHFKHKLKCCGS